MRKQITLLQAIVLVLSVTILTNPISTKAAQVIIQGVQQFGASAFNGTITFNNTVTQTAGQYLNVDGTAPLPAYSFITEPTLGLWRSSAANVTLQGNLTTTAALSVGSTSAIGFTSRAFIAAPAAGNLIVENQLATIGNTLKVDALPTVSSCGAGSPAVIAGSTPLSGAVTIGTTAVATCTVTFNGTAFPANAHCSGSVETSTAANTRAMGYVANTTSLVIVPSAAWADSSVVNWVCFSSK